MITGVRNINRVNLRLTTSTGDDMAKYSTTASLSAGSVTRVPTTLTTIPYSLLILDSSGNVLNPPQVTAQVLFASGIYNIDIYSTDAVSITLYITY